MISWEEIITLTIIFIFGTLFWISLMGIILRRTTKVRDIFSTNVEVKVSAFEEI
jgi:hypothetical protein